MKFQKQAVLRLFDVRFIPYNSLRKIIPAVFVGKFAFIRYLGYVCREINVISTVCFKGLLLPFGVQRYVAHIEIEYAVRIRYRICAVQIPTRKDIPYPLRSGEGRHTFRRISHIGNGRIKPLGIEGDFELLVAVCVFDDVLRR